MLTAHTTLDQAQLWVSQQLSAAGIEDSQYEARLIIQFYTDRKAIDLITQSHLTLGHNYEAITTAVARRQRHEPLSRIMGRRGFWTFDLSVAPDVLDPRPDSETIIEAARAFFRHSGHEPKKIADLGTGSGALLCALLICFPNAEGVGLDMSEAACALAQTNLNALKLSARGHIQHSDWSLLQGQYDLIVSNPPYIKSADIWDLDPSVRDYDPLLALDGGSDGLQAYRTLAPILARHSSQNGCVILEIGATQADDVSNILINNGFKIISAHQDVAGHSRALCAQCLKAQQIRD
jgi:release factor glutamine methyltransferase